MAKEIKVIKCPQCGSTVKIEIKPDFYHCSNCQTEYFLDDDDVTINYNHNYNHNNNSFSGSTDGSKKAFKIIGIIVGVFFILMVMMNVLTSVFAPRSYPNPVSIASAEEKGFSASRYQAQLFTQSADQALVVIVGEERRYRSKADEQKDGIYISFYSPGKNEPIGEHRILGEHISYTDVNMKTFTDGNLYIIINKSSFYLVDKDKLKLIDAGKKFFPAKAELQVGVATMEFVYDDSGDGLVLLTNDGKKLYYYPLIQKLYSEKDYYKAKTGFNTLLPDAKEKVIHVFTEKSSEYPDDKLQLIKLKYKDNGAGPKDIVDYPRWSKDYGRSGIFTDRDPYRKVLFGKYSMERDRMLDWKDLTPGRLYFEPKVIYDDGTSLLIKFKGDANPNSVYKLQKLNINTGAVEWTNDEPKNSETKRIISYKGGFASVSDNEEIKILDAKGKITATYKLN
ncbi:MAG: hypothetical protein WC623_11240 [Pedobacter sp.]|uniref:hypothetical protein n=1 Tax=Pedobacter sp. TaxID=1411316 RepID=UPI00356A3FA3